MKLTIAYGEGVFALPEEMMQYIDKASPLALKLFLELASDRSLREAFDTSAVAKRYAVTAKEIEDALSFWENAGLLNNKGASTPAEKKQKSKVSVKTSTNGESVKVIVSDDLPHYTGVEIENIMANNRQLSELIDECQRVVGKVFGVHEINQVIAMSDALGFANDAILLLFGYAETIGKCTVNYVVKVAQNLANKGLTGYDEIEAYIDEAEKIHTAEGIVRRLSGMGGRSFSAKEKRFVSAWSEYGFSEEILTMAYEITVNNTGEFSFPYMNKILVNWHEQGYKTKEEIENALKGYRDKKASASDTSFDVDEFFEAALKRSKTRPVTSGK